MLGSDQFGSAGEGGWKLWLLPLMINEGDEDGDAAAADGGDDDEDPSRQ